MAATINTNIASINAQRNLSLSGQSLNTTMQRLSSGLRVNSAKDDAAGLAIAERMNTQVKGLTVAARNANDGISLAQTAEGALGKVGDMLQRMRELAVQASNATNSASDRAALQAEVSQLSAEIDRVAKQTNFNGQKILDGSFAGAVFQVGANSGDNVTLGALADTRASMVSNISYATTSLTFNTSDAPTPAISNFDQAIKAGDLKITLEGLPSVELEGIGAANSSLERIGQVVTAINNKTADTGVTAYMTLKEGTQEYTISLMSSKLDANNQPLPIKFEGFTVSTTGIQGVPGPLVDTTAATYTGLAPHGVTDAATSTAFLVNLDAAIAADPTLAGLASQWANERTALENAAVGDETAAADTLLAKIQAEVTAYNTSAPAPNTDQLAFEASPKALADAITYGNALKALPGANSSFDFDATNPAPTLEAALAEVGRLEVATKLSSLSIGTQNGLLDQRGVDDIDVTTQAGAWIALKKIDSAVDQINGARATLGAMQTRFENAVNNIDIQVENLSAARGRIMDADFAVETANLSRTQILQQAGTAMVAQANQIPQNVLQLLQS
ncbi:flagellin [Comamonas aquatica]|uniref:flagellin N-terminal helical domain-containing protein n=1 Tax=Comamonas aquatica TaxID=225991 RepID=UPI0022DDA594|nr:flagellin [Comamonas aquatica]WBM42413.1 flagellin [Comamonas aquatica]